MKMNEVKWTLWMVCFCLFIQACRPQPGLRDTAERPSALRENNAPALPSPIPTRTFHLQLMDYPIDPLIEADYFVVDLFETPADLITALHEHRAIVLCYLNAGAWAEFRPDADDFPAEVIGRNYVGWPGERWLDISNYPDFANIMLARMDLAVAKGCDGIDADNVAGYQAKSGFLITASDQLAYNRWLSAEAHARGMLIGLKNDPDQAAELADDFDLAIVESCAVYGFCDAFQPFVQQGKPVFQVEYDDHFASTDAFCAESRELGYSAQLKHRELDAWSQPCP